jgi:hypothetical protein
MPEWNKFTSIFPSSFFSLSLSHSRGKTYKSHAAHSQKSRARAAPEEEMFIYVRILSP